MIVQRPLVSVVIPTRNRARELQQTLTILARQTYRPLEIIVIDDASDESLEQPVRSIWPDAVFVRKEINVGQSQCRNVAFQLAGGQYLLGLDDDACFTHETDIEKAISLLESSPAVGALTFFTFHGPELPLSPINVEAKRMFTHTFLAGAGMIRKSVIEQTGGYLDFFNSEGEEEELSLRILDRGWAIMLDPQVLIHHRVSNVNRNNARTWERGLRNKLSLIILHLPWRYVPIELTWKVAVALLDAIRLLRIRHCFRALRDFSNRLPRILNLRKPISLLTMHRYNAARFRGIYSLDDFLNPQPCGPIDLFNWFVRSWWNRPRNRSFWDGKSGGIGRSSTSKYAHELDPDRRVSRKC